jgi:acetyltransferase EpsM
MKSILILGAGGTAADIVDFIEEINEFRPTYTCLGFLDDKRELWGKVLLGKRVLGPLAMAAEFPDVMFANGLGSPGNFTKREAILSRVGIEMSRFETIVHPSARISKSSSIGLGGVVYPYCTIASNVHIGNHVTILAGTAINHDVVIENYTILASGASVSGGVRIGKSCYIGAGSSIIQGGVIGELSLVGMGSVVIRDVAPRSIVVGNPAKSIKRIEC